MCWDKVECDVNEGYKLLWLFGKYNCGFDLSRGGFNKLLNRGDMSYLEKEGR